MTGDPEQFLKAILDGAPVWVVTSDRDSGLITAANKPARIAFGKDEDSSLSVSGLDFWVNPADRQRLIDQLRQHDHAQAESELRLPDGQTIQVMIACQIDPKDSRNVLWWITNISEQKINQEKIFRHELMLEQILDSLPVAVFVKDINDDFRYILNNRKSVEIFESRGKDVIGRSDFESLDFDEATALREQDLKIARTGQPFVNQEQALPLPDGDVLYVSTKKVLLKDINDQPSLILGVSEDVSDRTETEKALRFSERRFREFAALLPVGIFLTDPKGGCIYVNDQWQKSTGMGLEQAAGNGWINALHPDDVEMVVTSWQRFIDGAAECVQELRFLRPNGQITWVSTNAVAFRNEDDEVVGFLSVSTDITNSKEFESRLQATSDEAQKANEAKSEFLSRMSHELRTPLNAVLGFGQLLQMNNENLTKSQNEGVEYILSAGDQLLHLIEDVLDFSCIESGHLNINMQRIPLRQVLQESISLVSGMAQKHQVELILKVGVVSDILADQLRLRQVLTNLLTNAIKYNTPGGLVTLEVSMQPDSFIRIAIIDTGLGIRPEDQVRLFEPFERVADQKNQVDGTGIGLSICSKLAQLMGGRLGFKSTYGAGSTFWVDLPAGTTKDAQAIVPEIENDSELMAGLQGIRILYVEDHLASIALLMKVAQHIPDCEFISATNVQDGVALAKSARPDLILMDIQMPGLDGFDALRLLQEDRRTRDIPAIALSAAAQPDIVQKTATAGFAHFLTKPLNLEDFFRSIVAVKRPPPKSKSECKSTAPANQ